MHTFLFVFTLFFCFSLASVSSSTFSYSQKTVNHDVASLDSLFVHALQEAAHPDSLTSTDLIALKSGTPSLKWRGQDEVLVVTWKSIAGFERLLMNRTRAPIFTSKAVIWVTPVPEVQEFCSQVEGTFDDVTLRLKQYLGLNYNWTYDVFVELWVHTSDLIRPCPDPRVDTYECSLEQDITKTVGHIPDYVDFYNGLYSTNFGRTWAGSLPWTGLGFTFDWGREGGRGASEYILNPGATLSNS